VRFHQGHFGVAVALFIVELSIALFVDDTFVRPYLGDVLVVPLVYCFVATFVDVRPALLGFSVFGFACAVEFTQRANLVTALGLQGNRLARTVLGTAYSTFDLVAYAVGAALTVGIHLGVQRLPTRR
jgi:hypothetical protein